ncbi:MAG: Beta-galactosidase C-terminal domain [Hominenteromicrobium sp.]
MDWTIPEAVELTVREQADGTQYVFLLNYSDRPQQICVRGGARQLLTGDTVCGACTMEPYGVLVFEIPKQ